MTKEVLDKVEEAVRKLMFGKKGHGFDHVERVYKLAMRFAEAEGADSAIVALAAWLHDADDYKLFGEENAKSLTNVRRIMADAGVVDELQEKVLGIIRTMGYSNTFLGVRPKTLEGMVVSDADMNDGLGAVSLVRLQEFSVENGKPFFVREEFPIENLSYKEYRTMTNRPQMCVHFERTLKLKKMMMTEAGKKEAEPRQDILVQFLRQYFVEMEAPEWTEYLEKFLEREYGKK